MAVVQSGLFSNPGTNFATTGRTNNDNPQGPQGGISDDQFPILNGKKQGTSTIDMSGSATRLQNTGMDAGGKAKQATVSATPAAEESTDTDVSFNNTEKDWRVRVSVSPASQILYRSSSPGILAPLIPTDGVIFPYAPTVSVTHQAKYNSQGLTHTNYTNYFYEASEVSAINISGEFSAQTPEDAFYVMAMIQFFRSATKMFYGDSGKYQGSPPPILYLDGYGPSYLPHVPCLLTSFQHTMPNNVDYIEIDISTGRSSPSASAVPQTGNKSNANFVRIPTMSSIAIGLQPIYSRNKQTTFNFDKFASGDLINKGFL